MRTRSDQRAFAIDALDFPIQHHHCDAKPATCNNERKVRSILLLALQMTRLDNPVLFLATADAERARAFYERVLGLALVADEPPALVFRVGDRMLRIQKVERVHAAPYTALGWAVSDIRQAVHKLRAAGVVFQRYEGMNQDGDGIWHAPSGAFVVWFQDPDGHVLSLTQFP